MTDSQKTPTLTHFDEAGNARMVDVGDKAPTRRRAVAEGFVHCSTELVEAISRCAGFSSRASSSTLNVPVRLAST